MNDKLKIVVYCDSITPRLNYTFNFIQENQDVEFELINDVSRFEKSDDLKLVYSDRYFEADYLQIFPADILFDEEIRDFSFSWKDNENDKVLIIDGKEDVLASIFVTLTNYRDYLVDSAYKDKHNRVPIKYNILFQGRVHQKLMVERWAKSFVEKITSFYGKEIVWRKHQLSILPTFDIDLAFAYLEKPNWRESLSKAKDLIKNDKERKKERNEVKLNQKKDPYDTFDYICALNNRGFSPKVFWLLGDYSKYDKNIPYENQKQATLISSVAANTEIGIHPSYKSNEILGLLNKEVNRLERILAEKVTKSRQHFLKLEFPKTYKSLIQEGIKEDFSLGFAEEFGFRVGTIRPHYWYDLKNEKITGLILHPFSYMDGTLLEYQKLSIQEAKNTINTLFEEAQKFGGEFSFIWHNSTIGDYGKWKGWSVVLEHTLNLKKST